MQGLEVLAAETDAEVAKTNAEIERRVQEKKAALADAQAEPESWTLDEEFDEATFELDAALALETEIAEESAPLENLLEWGE